MLTIAEDCVDAVLAGGKESPESAPTRLLPRPRNAWAAGRGSPNRCPAGSADLVGDECSEASILKTGWRCSLCYQEVPNAPGFL